jgi:hypothetical protein
VPGLSKGTSFNITEVTGSVASARTVVPDTVVREVNRGACGTGDGGIPCSEAIQKMNAIIVVTAIFPKLRQVR